MIKYVLLTAFLFPLLALAQAPNLAELDIVERSVPDGPVALVDGSPVTREDFLRVYHEQLAMFTKAKSGEKVDDPTRVKTALATLGELIQREVLFLEARKRNIQVGDAEVAAAFQKQIQSLQEEAQQTGGKAPTEAEVLARIHKTREVALNEIRRALLIQRVSQQISQGREAKVSDAEVEKFYKENAGNFQRGGTLHLKQIFVKPQADAQKATPEQWAAAQQRIEQAMKRIHAGESFDAVAKAASDAPDNKNGGDMGEVPVESLPPFYVDVARQMKPGEISKIFKTQVGLHFIQLVSQQGGGTVSLEEVKPKIKAFLEHRKTGDAVDAYCQNIVTNPDRVKTYLQLDRTLAMLPELKGLSKSR